MVKNIYIFIILIISGEKKNSKINKKLSETPLPLK